MTLYLTVRHHHEQQDDPRRFPVEIDENGVHISFADFTTALEIVKWSYVAHLQLETEDGQRVASQATLDRLTK